MYIYDPNKYIKIPKYDNRRRNIFINALEKACKRIDMA